MGLEGSELETPDGDLLSRVLDIDFALRAGVTVTLSEINVEEFSALKVLHSERDRYEMEQTKQTPAKWSSVD